MAALEPAFQIVPVIEDSRDTIPIRQPDSVSERWREGEVDSYPKRVGGRASE